jgi:hypothetical protein
MNEEIRNDIAKYPDVFWFEKPLDEPELYQADRLLQPPNDLLAFWREFGAGLMFESERILRPFTEDVSMSFITEREKAQGWPSHLTVFHLGVVISGFDSKGFEAFDVDSYNPLGRFDTLDGWYVNVIKDIFGDRYGLSS